MNTLKRKLAEGRPTYGLWVTLEAPTITEIAVELGLDWVVIDAEHGHLDFKEILEHVRVTRNSATTPLVRIQEIEQGLIKRVLDLGAQGILAPQVRTAAEVELAVRFAKYPPWGVRGVGGERATGWGRTLRSSTASANEETLVIPLIETVEAGAAFGAILEVPGVDALFFGPADYSASAGYLGEWEGPGVAERLLELRKQAGERGIPCGVMSTSIRNAQERRDQGFRMVSIGPDTGLLIRAAVEALEALGVDVPAPG
jgi:2-keto-3-deoxy-L-rhamnonate aldolase RhmA